jgi:hypothetical protein
MLELFDWVRVLSVCFAFATIFILIKFWYNYPKYQPQFSLILFYLIHGILYYSIVIVDKIANISFMTDTSYNNWGAVLRFHSFITWFFVAFLYVRIQRHKHG